METRVDHEKFSRQTLLPGVGQAGQEKWDSSFVALAGEGIVLESAREALLRSGVRRTALLVPGSPEPPLETDLLLIATADPEFRRDLSRLARAGSRKALFAWVSTGGFSLFSAKPETEKCPCFECFEVMNPKAFAPLRPPMSAFGPRGTGGLGGRVEWVLGAAAASEALLWLLKGESPIAGKVWTTSLEDGTSFLHPVRPSAKCPAMLCDTGPMAAL
jgi:hypothetical protein